MAKRRYRQQINSPYEDLYQRLPLSNKHECYYCTMPADSVDHVPPIKSADCYSPVTTKFWLVQSCRRCNSWLGAMDLDVQSRKLFVIEKIEKEFQPYLTGNRGKFTDNEIMTCGGRMRQRLVKDRRIRRAMFTCIGLRPDV